MKIISVVNYKGGVGKTTLTANLAGELARKGRKVLMIDVDPQASLTFSFIQPEVWRKNLSDRATIMNWYESLVQGPPITLESLRREPVEVKRKLPPAATLHLIASHLELLEVDLQLASQLASVSPKQMQQNFLRVHSYLAAALRQLPPDLYDYVFIDCPPSFSLVTKNAIVATDYILVPTRPDHVSTIGLNFLKRRIDQLVEDYRKMAEGTVYRAVAPRYLGVVFTMIELFRDEPIAAQREAIGQLHRSLNDPTFHFFEHFIRHNTTKFSDAPEKYIPFVLLGDPSPLGKDITEELRGLATEVEEQITKGKKDGQPQPQAGTPAKPAAQGGRQLVRGGP